MAVVSREVLSWLPTENKPMFFPLHKESLPLPTASAPAQSSAEPGTKKRILFADDNADMRCYVQRLLTPCWEVEVVANGKEALEVIQRQLPDLILTDIMMPKMAGFQLLKAVRSNLKTSLLPVIMLSAGAEAKLESLQVGANDYFIKPFSAKELIMRISTHLELGHLRLQLEKQIQEEIQLRLREEKQQKDLENFIDTIYHEIRNPLSGIMGSVELLQSAIEKIENFFSTTPSQSFVEDNKIALLPLIHEIEDLIKTIHTCSEQQKIIVNDVLDYSKLENQKFKLMLKTFKLKELLQSAISMFMPQIQLKQLQLETDFPEENIWVKSAGGN